VWFDTTCYLAACPDVQASHANPLVHDPDFAIHEGRLRLADRTWG
jgi:hypothetical protein